MTDKFRWGILGTGNIAKQFARGLVSLPDAELTAVGSRSLDSAVEFAREFQVAHPHGSYESLAQNPDIDAIYIATPHSLHCDNALLCMENGKAVLCEKPFTVNAAEAQRVVEKAREKKLFLMEAMWTRFLPAIIQTRQWITEGKIGEPRMLLCEFGFRIEKIDPKSRLWDPNLAGGALLDIGVYNVSLASMIFGKPSRIAGCANLSETGVDEQSSVTLQYASGAMATLTCAFRTSTRNEAYIYGTKGHIRLFPNFPVAQKAALAVTSEEEIEVPLPFKGGNGYHYEAMEVMRCMRQGQLESEIIPLAETVEIMATMDEMRRQWGLKYPMEI